MEKHIHHQLSQEEGFQFAYALYQEPVTKHGRSALISYLISIKYGIN